MHKQILVVSGFWTPLYVFSKQTNKFMNTNYVTETSLQPTTLILLWWICHNFTHVSMNKWANLISQIAASGALLRMRPESVSWRWRAEESERSRSLNSWGTLLRWSKALPPSAHALSQSSASGSVRIPQLFTRGERCCSELLRARHGVNEPTRVSDFRR